MLAGLQRAGGGGEERNDVAQDSTGGAFAGAVAGLSNLAPWGMDSQSEASSTLGRGHAPRRGRPRIRTHVGGLAHAHTKADGTQGAVVDSGSRV